MGFNFFIGIGGSALLLTLLAIPGVGFIVVAMAVIVLFACFFSSEKTDTTRDDIVGSGEKNRQIGLIRSKIEQCDEEIKWLKGRLPEFERHGAKKSKIKNFEYTLRCKQEEREKNLKELGALLKQNS